MAVQVHSKLGTHRFPAGVLVLDLLSSKEHVPSSHSTLEVPTDRLGVPLEASSDFKKANLGIVHPSP